MGAHLVLERMKCDKNAYSDDEGIYVRAVLNEAVMPFPNCHDGPGFSCKLDDYEEKVFKKNYQSFVDKCSSITEEDLPLYVDFYWSYNQTNIYNYQQGDIAYQMSTWFGAPGLEILLEI